MKSVHEKFESGAYFSFNYNTLLFVASVVAGLGLVSNSAAVVIARYECACFVACSRRCDLPTTFLINHHSMLVSPIMGPVVGLAYGMTIHDWKLVRLSFRNEIISLVFCITIGVIIGVFCGLTDLSE